MKDRAINILALPIIVLLLIIVSWGCSERKPDTLKSGTLAEMIDDLAYRNNIQLNEIEYIIKEKGNREEEVTMLHKLKKILFYPQEDNFFLPAEADSVNLVNLSDYTRHLVSEAEQYNWEGARKPSETIDRLMKSEAVFRESRSQLDYDIFTLNLSLLKKAFIDEICSKTGILDLIDYGQVEMTYAADTLKKDEKFTALLTAGKKIEEDIFEIGQAYLLLSDSSGEIREFMLEYVGGGGWIFSYIPRQAGTYQFEFGFTLHSKVDRYYPGYPFYIKRNLYVE